jgi:hypothetical protein
VPEYLPDDQHGSIASKSPSRVKSAGARAMIEVVGNKHYQLPPLGRIKPQTQPFVVMLDVSARPLPLQGAELTYHRNQS